MKLQFHLRWGILDLEIMRGKKCSELSEKAPHPGQLDRGELSRVLWRDVQGIVVRCPGYCVELSWGEPSLWRVV